MWSSDATTAEKMLRKYGVNPTHGKALEVGGSSMAVVDNAPAANPILRISPQVKFFDMGFMSPYGGIIHIKDDFTNPASTILLKDTFDVVYTFQTLEHVDIPTLFAANLVHVTKPGGHIFVSTVFDFPYHPSPKDFWRFSPDGLRVLFRQQPINILYSGWGAEKGGVMLFGQKLPSYHKPYSGLDLAGFLQYVA